MCTQRFNCGIDAICIKPVLINDHSETKQAELVYYDIEQSRVSDLVRQLHGDRGILYTYAGMDCAGKIAEDIKEKLS